MTDFETADQAAEQSDCMWIWCDIDGSGKRWRLAIMRDGTGDDGEDERMVYFPVEDFEDFWEGNYDDDLAVPVMPPAGKPAAAPALTQDPTP